MHLFNTFLGLGALIVAGLIGATITFLLMNLGLPDKTPFQIRWRLARDKAFKEKFGVRLTEEQKEDLRKIEEIMDENRRFR